MSHVPVVKQALQFSNWMNKADSPFYGSLGSTPATTDTFGTGKGTNIQPAPASGGPAPSSDFNQALASARATYAQHPSQDTQYFSWTNPSTGKLETYYIGNYQSGGAVRGNNAVANAMRLARR